MTAIGTSYEHDLIILSLISTQCVFSLPFLYVTTSEIP